MLVAIKETIEVFKFTGLLLKIDIESNKISLKALI